MQLTQIINKIKKFIIDRYNKLVSYIKNIGKEKPKINNQNVSNQDIHIVKARVKKIGNKKLKTNL